jgi:hypothetical protein
VSVSSGPPPGASVQERVKWYIQDAQEQLAAGRRLEWALQTKAPKPPPTLWQRLLGTFKLLRTIMGVVVVADYVPPPAPDNAFFRQLVAQLANEDRRNIIMAFISADVAAIARETTAEWGEE